MQVLNKWQIASKLALPVSPSQMPLNLIPVERIHLFC